MALSELEKIRIEKLFTDYCEQKIPLHIRDQIRIEFQIRGDEVSLFECRAPWRGEDEWTSMKVATEVSYIGKPVINELAEWKL